jgi:hypothetical protein
LEKILILGHPNISPEKLLVLLEQEKFKNKKIFIPEDIKNIQDVLGEFLFILQIPIIETPDFLLCPDTPKELIKTEQKKVFKVHPRHPFGVDADPNQQYQTHIRSPTSFSPYIIPIRLTGICFFSDQKCLPVNTFM